MYGLVNKAVQDLVVKNFGEETWTKVKQEASVNVPDFVALQTYDDTLTFSLVGAASKLLKTPAEEILRSFGRHWILFTAKEGYGDLMDMFGRDFRTCLKNLNQMHGRMGAMMPDLVPPRFVVKETSPTSMTMEYHSKRIGLAPMVIGLLEGLAEKHKVNARVTHLPPPESKKFELFQIDIKE